MSGQATPGTGQARPRRGIGWPRANPDPPAEATEADPNHDLQSMRIER